MELIFEGVKESSRFKELRGAIAVLEPINGVFYGEMVEFDIGDGSRRLGRVLEAGREAIIVQVFEGTAGISTSKAKAKFLGQPFKLGVSEEMLGRVFNGTGKPIDDYPLPTIDKEVDINGLAINPMSRDYPRDIIQTGISAIDAMNTLVRGQKLPIFSGSGLPHNEIVAQIIKQASVSGKAEKFAIVFAAMGIRFDEALFFRDVLENTANMDKVTMFLNLADDPPEERIITPRCALTLAEYLAFEKGRHVLVIIGDMTNYCESLRELSAARDEVPSRKGYPGYMYTDLASLYERCGRVKDREGSVTLIPFLTMPNMDISHPIPDLTGYITEGQIVLSRALYQKGIYPPIDLPPSLSRLMKDAIGKGRTREDHPNVANQLYASYAEVQWIRSLADIVGEEELSERDKKFLEFGEKFEKRFLSQGYDENRSLEQTLNIAWEVLSILPENQLHRLTKEQIEKYYNRD